MQVFRKLIFLVLFIMQPICSHAEVINRVVAIVNDEVITQQDIDQLLGVLYAQYVHAYKEDELLEKMQEVKRDILRQMIEDKLILSRAKELGVNVTQEEIDQKLESVKSGIPPGRDFYDMLESQGITVADLKSRYRDQIMVKKLVDFEVKSRVTVLPSEISEYYENNRKKYEGSEKYKVRHILIKAEDEVGAELAKVEIEDIYNKIKAGHDFSELAKEYSQGPNREQGGDMGYVGQGEMLKELDEAIFGLKPGEFSTPVKSRIGYHIFLVDDIGYSDYSSLEEMQGDIKVIIFQEKFKEILNEWLTGLRSEAYISIK
jgi:parvulin-like peptidyl-prolyl isomerase